MRIQMKLSRITILAFREFKIIKYGDPNIRITNGYLLGVAYKSIEPIFSSIEWENIEKKALPYFSIYDEEVIDSVITTLNIERDILEGIEQLQKHFLTVFGTKRIHKAFVVKLIMLAAILNSKHDKL